MVLRRGLNPTRLLTHCFFLGENKRLWSALRSESTADAASAVQSSINNRVSPPSSVWIHPQKQDVFSKPVFCLKSDLTLVLDGWSLSLATAASSRATCSVSFLASLEFPLELTHRLLTAATMEIFTQTRPANI